MTKRIRIENADTSSHKVVVETWEKRADGQPDVKVSEKSLDYPTAMTGEDTYVTSTRYLVVREA
jgi:hypothetical protein